MIRKCIKKSENLNLNHNYVVLKTAKSMLKVIDNTMEGVWYDESFFEIKECFMCSHNKECEDNHYSRKQYYCIIADYKDFEPIKQEDNNEFGNR